MGTDFGREFPSVSNSLPHGIGPGSTCLSKTSWPALRFAWVYNQEGLSGKEFTYNAEDMDSSPESGIFSGGGSGNPLQCSFLKNPMDRGAWWAIVQRVAKSRTRLEQLSMGSGKNLKDWLQELKLQRQLNLINQTTEQFMLQGTVENTATSQQMVEPKT